MDALPAAPVIATHASDGMFPVPHPPEHLAFTGERMTTARHGQIAFEHLHRYCIARDLCAGKDVLDVASGEGYGAAILAGIARQVIGVEIEAETVRHARASYPAPNLTFIRADAHDLPLRDASCDVAVSFETLEHLRDPGRFLREIRRVLRPDGILIVSTPDRMVYSAPGQPVNPFHVTELTLAELQQRLGSIFAHQRILHQRAVLGSIATQADRAGTWRSYDRRNAAVIEAASGVSRAFYLIGIASDAPLPPFGGSAYADFHPIDHLLQAVEDQPRQAAALDIQRARSAELEARIGELMAHIAELAKAQESASADWQRLIEARQHELEQERAGARRFAERVAALEQSTWWRLGGPLRAAATRYPFAARMAKRVARRLMGRRSVAPPLPNDPPAQATSRPLPRAEDIALPHTPEPVVSVIIPTFGKTDYTLRCLAAVSAHPPEVPIEVIVVDDASGDPGIATLRAIPNLRLEIWPENRGFLRSCNAAAALARGAFLMLLNNDTEVQQGAIDHLHRLLLTRPDTGMAGARLLFPDGTQQEAGGIVWRDGSAWNYGRDDDPRKPEYNYVREADYVSGAAIMLRREAWDRMAGFDESYAPAYCEDTDLAFRLRAAGMPVLYQPAARVVHHEGVSHGRDPTAGGKAHQVTNTARFARRWRAVLRANHLPSGSRIMRARDRSIGRRVTLVLDHYVPEPDRDGGSRSMMAILRALLSAGRVVKFVPANLHPTPGYTAALQQMGIEVIHAPWYRSFAEWIAANGAEIDEVLLSRPDVAQAHLPALNAHCAARIVFYGHDLHHARMRREPGVEHDVRKLADAARMEALEREIWRAADVVMYPSEEEAQTVRAMEPGIDARAIPAFGFPPVAARPPDPPASPLILFVAGFAHPPNQDAAAWLVTQIMPRVRAACPEARLALVGSNPSAAVRALASDHVEVTGAVSDAELTARYEGARVAACPLRYGAGVKLKVLEAMHHGVPLVTTPTGAQGIPGLADVCAVHDEADAFAASVVALLRDDALWTARAGAQRRLIRDFLSPERLQAALDDALAPAVRRQAA